MNNNFSPEEISAAMNEFPGYVRLTGMEIFHLKIYQKREEERQAKYKQGQAKSAERKREKRERMIKRVKELMKEKSIRKLTLEQACELCQILKSEGLDFSPKTIYEAV